VYNGADFVDTKNNFKSDIFQAVVVHLPMKFCVSWRKDVELKASEKKIQDMKREEDALEEARQYMKRALQEKEEALEEALQDMKRALQEKEEAHQEIINLRNRLSEIPNEIQ
jgi:Skp family chaperone for outer membrane proteins